ncbi:MAG: glycoside hydrolase [Bacteroidota bacterium]|nr:glycoside hydrolase [Bacteroidota bacterium]
MHRIYIVCFLFWMGTGISQTIQWSAEQKITTGGNANIRPRMVSLNSDQGIIVYGHLHNQSISYVTWNQKQLGIPKLLNINSSKAFVTDWASTEVAGKDAYVYIVFKADPADTASIYLCVSKDYGQSFSTPIQIVKSTIYRSRFPGVAIDKNYQPIVSYMRFNMSWENPEYVSIRSDDFGQSFSSSVQVTDPSLGIACDCCPVSVESDGDRVAVLFRNNRANIRNMMAVVSLNGGESYTQRKELDIENWLIHSCPATGADGFFSENLLHTTWMSGRSGSGKVYYSRYNLESNKIDQLIQLENPAGRKLLQNYPRMAGSGDTVGIIWQEQMSTADIFFSWMTKDVTQLNPNSVLLNTITGGSQLNPELSFRDGIFYACWQDNGDQSIKWKYGKIQSPSSTKNPEIELLKLHRSSGFLQIQTTIQTESIEIMDAYGRIIERTLDQNPGFYLNRLPILFFVRANFRNQESVVLKGW